MLQKKFAACQTLSYWFMEMDTKNYNCILVRSF